MASNLILPAHIGNRRAQAMKDPGIQTEARVEGKMNQPDEWFDEEKERIRKRIGWALDKFSMKLNRVLVAVFIRPSEHQFAGGGSIMMPE